MSPRGKPRKFDPTIPSHIDQAALPKGVYWDRSGRGRWYVFEVEGARKKRRTIAGPDVRLSDLHAIVEQAADHATVEWLAREYHSSPKFAKLARTTQADYEYSRGVLLNFKTAAGGRVATLIADRLLPFHLQRMVDHLEREGTPTKANKLLRYSRLLFGWGLRRGLVKQNPAKGLEAAVERRQQRLPSDDAYAKLATFAQARGALKAHTAGSVAPYLWMIMELGYLCRLRGVETLTLTLAQADVDGIRTQRRKGSRDNVVEWNDRLRTVWAAAIAYRREVIERTTNIEPMRPEDRRLFLTESGDPLSKSGLDSAWQRLVTMAMREGVIAASERFSPHDLKRKGGTDTPGTRAEKQEALGLSEAMMKVYDKSVPRSKPSA